MFRKALKRGIMMAATVVLSMGIVIGGNIKDIQAAAVVDVNFSSDSVAVGEKVALTITSQGADAEKPQIAVSFDTDYLTMVGCDSTYSGGDNGIVTINASSAKLTFNAKKDGTATVDVKAKVSEDGAQMGDSVSVKIGDGAQSNLSAESSATASSAAYLKTLNVTPGTITPDFSPEVTKYSIQVDSDVESVSVTCSVADSTSKVIEAGGFKSLKDGKNDAVVTVEAADGSTCSYQLTIYRGETAALDTEDTGATADTEGTETTAVVDGDQIPVGGETIFSSFQVCKTFPQELLPDGFVEEDYDYKGVTVQSAYFAAGDVRLLYLTAGDGTSADFRVYYDDQDEFIDFLQLKNTDGKFIFPVRYQAQIKIPDSYTDSFLPWGDKVIDCFIYSELVVKDDKASDISGTDTADETGAGAAVEGSSTDTTPADTGDNEVEFYLIYAMNNEGKEGFYLYDIVEGTYQRYVERDTSYELDQSYFKYKDVAHQRFAIMCILGVALVIAVFVIINMAIKNSELKSDLGLSGKKRKGTDEDDEEEDEDENSGDESGDEEEAETSDVVQNLEIAAEEIEQDYAATSELPNVEEALQQTKAAEKKKVQKKEPQIPVDDDLEARIIAQLKAAETEAEAVQAEPEANMKKSEQKTQAKSNFKMINLSREPEATGLDDDFEFEFIKLDDD